MDIVSNAARFMSRRLYSDKRGVYIIYDINIYWN